VRRQRRGSGRGFGGGGGGQLDGHEMRRAGTRFLHRRPPRDRAPAD
jgi:hypothetical protein